MILIKTTQRLYPLLLSSLNCSWRNLSHNSVCAIEIRLIPSITIAAKQVFDLLRKEKTMKKLKFALLLAVVLVLFTA